MEELTSDVKIFYIRKNLFMKKSSKLSKMYNFYYMQFIIALELKRMRMCRLMLCTTKKR